MIDYIQSFFNSFYANHVILYVGRSATPEEIRAVAACKWSAVITTRTEPEFSLMFKLDDREVLDYTKRSDISSKPLSRQKLPVIRLFGTEGDVVDEYDDIWGDGDEDQSGPSNYEINNAADLFKLLPALLDYVNVMSVIGIHSQVDLDLLSSRECGTVLLKEVVDGAVTFWGEAPDSLAGMPTALQKIISRKKFSVCSKSLPEIVCKNAAEEAALAANTPNNLSDSDIFFSGNKPVSISQSDLLKFKNVGTLLTERTIHSIRPFGREQCRPWFSNFLELSASEGPQWYGYLPQSLFYVKRSFEDPLVQLARRMLAGRGIENEHSMLSPIILEGDPGSSKSITLAALAYRIYNEKINPVFYINNDTFLSQGFGSEFDALCDILEQIHDSCEKDTRILVIWDSSSYRSVIEHVKRLQERLQNVGRRIVLVCSSYSIRKYENQSEKYYRRPDKDSSVFVSCDSREAEVIYRSGCYFIKAVRDMSSREQTEFWNRVKDFSGISATTVSFMRKKLIAENQNSIFYFYYMLISVLRDNLEKGLKNEQSKVYHYVQNELNTILQGIERKKTEDKHSTSMYDALIRAGISPELLGLSSEVSAPGNTDETELDLKLERFNICIALFSRFKLEVPYSLAYAILTGTDGGEIYSSDSRQLFSLVSNDIPWLIYGENTEGDYSFRFRNPLEADIFLHNHDITGDMQVDIVCDILRMYGESYRTTKCLDSAMGSTIQKLLRLIGPNSSYPFEDFNRKADHESMLTRLNDLVEGINELFDVYGVPDPNCDFTALAVTFAREYYGHRWVNMYAQTADSPNSPYGSTYFMPEDYIDRIKKLRDAITTAQSGIEQLERTLREQSCRWQDGLFLQRQVDSLAVECALCQMELDDVIDDYQKCCWHCECQPQVKAKERILHYSYIHKLLRSVIRHQPTNGYAYNALFKAFERMYDQGSFTKERRLHYLSEIMQTVEECEALDSEIFNRGSKRDELSEHLSKIRSFAASVPITIDAVVNRKELMATADPETAAFFQLYDALLQANNPAAITFVCQKELVIPRGKLQLDSAALWSCKKVLDFMTDPENYLCVSSSPYAVAMLIRIAWMSYNEIPLNTIEECQTTKISDEQWWSLHKYCQQYQSITKETDRQPLYMLVSALATLHTSRLSEEGFRKADEILRSIPEDIFYHDRMRSPYMICDENGSPIDDYSGTVLETDKENGWVKVYGIPQYLRRKPGVRFRHYNLGKKTPMPQKHQTLSGLEIGVGYTGFSVYTEAGRQERRKHNL
jgi:hypothetical protein